jgi:hypothetical protein
VLQSLENLKELSIDGNPVFFLINLKVSANVQFKYELILDDDNIQELDKEVAL